MERRGSKIGEQERGVTVGGAGAGGRGAECGLNWALTVRSNLIILTDFIS